MKSKFVVKVSSRYNKPYVYKTPNIWWFLKSESEIRYKDYSEHGFLTNYTLHVGEIDNVQDKHHYYDSKKEAKESILADSNCKDYTDHLTSRTYEIVKIYTND